MTPHLTTKKAKPMNKQARSLALAALAITTGGLALLVPQLAQATKQAPWPNLKVLKDYPKLGDTCTPDGAAAPGSEKAKSNALKNRWELPAGGWSKFKKIDFADFVRLPLGPGDAAPKADDPTNARPVILEGYVRAVKKGGSRGESCNCNAKGAAQIDTHIEVVPDGSGPEVNDTKGKGMIVVETTVRSRMLAEKGLLKTNIGNDWSLRRLKDKIEGRRVRFYGWAFYDPDHHLEAWRADKDDRRGRANWRETGWEIHPVMGIETL